MKRLLQLSLVLALTGCGSSTTPCHDAGVPPPSDGGSFADAGSDAGTDAGSDAGRVSRCQEVEDLYYGPGLDELGCALSCPWEDPCTSPARYACLDELQTAGGLLDCARWEAALASPLCTAACTETP